MVDKLNTLAKDPCDLSYAIVTIFILSVWSKDAQIIIKVACGAGKHKYEKVDIDCYLQEVCEEISVWLDIAIIMHNGVHCQEYCTYSLQDKQRLGGRSGV